MNYLHYEVDTSATSTIVVTLDKQANVLLLDSINYQNYQQGRSYKYQGGLAKVSPVRLKPPCAGHWHVVINLGGYSGTVHASVRVIG